LVGEGLEQGDLPVGEELSLDAPEADGADGHTFSHQRNDKKGPVAEASCALAALRVLVDFGL
jgi:hypothetical protein